jgi:hypothetical protein
VSDASLFPPPTSHRPEVTGAGELTTAALDADTRAAHDRNNPVVKARMRRWTKVVSTEGRLIDARSWWNRCRRR